MDASTLKVDAKEEKCHTSETMPEATKCTPIEEKWAQAYACKAMTKSDAWRLCHPSSKASPDAIYVEAYKLSKRPQVLLRTAELLNEMAVDSIVSGQDVLRMMMDDRETALAAGLPGAAISASEKLMRHKALLTDRVISLREGSGLDEDIAKTLAGGDPRKERQLRAIIGSDGAFAPLEVVEDENATDATITEGDSGLKQAK